MDFYVRDAVVSDYKQITEICINDLGYECSEQIVKARLQNLTNDCEKVFVACTYDSIIGFIHAEKYEPLYFETTVNLLGLAVKKDFRKNGAGHMLLDECENWAKSLGAKYVRLNSGASRDEAHSFYRNSGYDKEKTQIRFLKEVN